MIEKRFLVPTAGISRRTLSLVAVAMAATACGGGSGGVDSSSEPPRFTLQPVDVSATVGAQATFRVAAESTEPVSYQWLRDGNAIAGATNAEYSVKAASLADHGARFSVVARNSAGPVESIKATLSVTPGKNAGNMALAEGALASIGVNQWFVSYSRSGDVFVWDRDNRRIVRYNAAGNRVPFAGSLQELPLGAVGTWQRSISIVEHSDGNVYISASNLEPSGRINVDRGAGGKIYRVTPEGSVTDIYDSQNHSVKITPYKLVEGVNGQLYTVHLNTVTLYRLSTSGEVIKVSDLSSSPVSDLGVVFGIAAISLVATETRTVYVGFEQGDDFIYRLSAEDKLVPVSTGLGGARHLAAVAESVYAFLVPPGSFPTVVRLESDTALTVISGGIRPPVQGEAGFGEPAGLGPLPGWIPYFTQVFAAAPGGRIVMGGNSESGSIFAPYFVLSPPGHL